MASCAPWRRPGLSRGQRTAPAGSGLCGGTARRKLRPGRAYKTRWSHQGRILRAADGRGVVGRLPPCVGPCFAAKFSGETFKGMPAAISFGPRAASPPGVARRLVA